MGATAILGDVMLTSLQLLPFALFLGVPLLFFRQPLFYWVSGLVMLMLVWFTRPTFRVVGREIFREEAVVLFADIDEISAALNVGGKTRIMVDEAFNASAAESRGLFGIFGTTRVLTLGLPLLATLSRSQILAVIAHEFGHFSKRHGRLGHWIYRARIGWLDYVETDHTSNRLDKAIQWAGNIFVPYFAALSFVHSRQCEYEADADAASVVGVAQLSGALTRITIQAIFWDQELAKQASIWQHETQAAPSDYYDRASRCALEWECNNQPAILVQALAEATGYIDTHPSLSKRLHALDSLNIGADYRISTEKAGGAELFGDTWAHLCQSSNEAWKKGYATDWAAAFFYYKFVLKEMLTPEASATIGWPVSCVLTRIRALKVANPETALGEIKALRLRMPDDADVAFLYAAMLIDYGNSTALLTKDGVIKEAAEDASDAGEAGGVIAMLKKLWEENRVYRAKVADMLCDHFKDVGNIACAEEWRSKYLLTIKTRATAYEKVWKSLAAQQCDTESLSDQMTQYLSATFESDTCISSAWLFLSRQTLIASRGPEGNILAVHILWLQIDTRIMQQAGGDEDEIADRHRRALSLALPLCDAALVKTTLTTEPLPAELNQVRPVFSRVHKNEQRAQN